MICEKCGIEITSEKIWRIHIVTCEGIEEKKEIRVPENIVYKEMGFHDLKSLASKRDINTYTMTKKEIIKSLLDADKEG